MSCFGTWAAGLRWRVAASVLLFWTITPLLIPLAVPDPESALPPCCRRDGKHHCAMMAAYMARQLLQAEGPAFESQTADCPYRSALFAPVAPRGPAAPLESAHQATLVSRPATPTHHPLLPYVSLIRSRQERGPPHTCHS